MDERAHYCTEHRRDGTEDHPCANAEAQSEAA